MMASFARANTNIPSLLKHSLISLHFPGVRFNIISKLLLLFGSPCKHHLLTCEPPLYELLKTWNSVTIILASSSPTGASST